jgi:hypothetical protein
MDSGVMTVEKFLILIAAITSIVIGVAAYRFIEHAYGANISFLVGFTTLVVSVYLINTSEI